MIYDVGDWEGEEEVVVERFNDLIYMVWDCLFDDFDCELIDEIINGIWEYFCGDLVFIEVDFEELIDWVIYYVDLLFDEKM